MNEFLPDRYLLKPYMMECPAVGQLAERIVNSGNRASSPIIVGWLLTTKCQLDCQHCWVKRNQPEASSSEREKIAWKLAQADICRVSLSGGEVTLLPDLAHIVKILKSTGTPICLYTNAIDPLSSKGIKNWLDYWDIETDYIQVSLDGGDIHEFEAQRGKGAFASFIKGVKLLRRLGVRTMAHYVATPYNGGNVYSAAKLASDLNCNAFSAEIFYPEGKAANISYANEQETARKFTLSLEHMLQDTQLMRQPIEIGIAIPNQVPLPSFLQQYKTQTELSYQVPVRHGTILCFVTPTGKVVPASHLDYQQNFCCGSLLNNDLGEIWRNGAGFSKIPRFRDLSTSRCASCNDFWFCRGGNEQRARDFYGTYHAPDPHCYHIGLSTNTGKNEK